MNLSGGLIRRDVFYSIHPINIYGRTEDSKKWVNEIEIAAERLENFEVNTQNKAALEEIFEEVYREGGRSVADELGELVIETCRNGRHPKAKRARRYARSLLREQGVEFDYSSPLVE